MLYYKSTKQNPSIINNKSNVILSLFLISESSQSEESIDFWR